MSTKTTKRGRPSLISMIRAKLGETNVFPTLEATAAKAVANNDGKVTMKVVVDAIKEHTELAFGPNALRAMIDRFGKGKVRADSTLGQVVRIKRGAPIGSCLGMVRNPDGKKGSLKTRRSRAAAKGQETKRRNAELATATG